MNKARKYEQECSIFSATLAKAHACCLYFVIDAKVPTKWSNTLIQYHAGWTGWMIKHCSSYKMLNETIWTRLNNSPVSSWPRPLNKNTY